MLAEMADLLGKREIFRGLQEIARDNSRVLEPGAFFNWLSTNYVTTVTIGARRFVDQSEDSHSLWRMLFEILEHPGAISRRSHTSFYQITRPGFGDALFSNMVGSKKAECLSQQQIRADLRAIEKASDRIRLFVNKRVAHLTAKGKLRRLPNFDELDAAIDTIDRTLCKYNLLLLAVPMSSAKATPQYEWTDVLKSAWIEK